jgi:type VI secretion system protein VasD
MRAHPVAPFIAILCSLLAACGGPSPTRLAMTVTASSQLNPNSDNQPSPTVVSIYDLKSQTTFMSASFDDLFYNDTATLGGDLLAHRQLNMLPGRTLTLKDEAAPGTTFVGVVAGFRMPQGAAWRGVLEVAPQSRNKIAITLAPTSVSIAKPPSGGWF